MSDTPETDNLARGNHVVPTEFARDLERERNQWRACAKGLAAAASDMQSGWFYIQEVYGRLSGVGWDRTAQGVEAALAEFERLKEAGK
jgi:hypothetical protein